MKHLALTEPLRWDRTGGGDLVDTVLHLENGFASDRGGVNCVIWLGRENRIKNVRIDTGKASFDASSLHFVRSQDPEAVVDVEDVVFRGFAAAGFLFESGRRVTMQGVKGRDCHQILSFQPERGKDASKDPAARRVEEAHLVDVEAFDTWGPAIYLGAPKPDGSRAWINSQRSPTDPFRYRGSDCIATTAKLLTMDNVRTGGACMMGVKAGKIHADAAPSRTIVNGCQIGGGYMGDEGTVLAGGDAKPTLFHDYLSHYEVPEPTTELLYVVDGGVAWLRAPEFEADPGRTLWAVHVHRNARAILQGGERRGDARVHVEKKGELFEVGVRVAGSRVDT